MVACGSFNHYDDSVKIATFNVNGIRSRLGNLLDWLQRETPDVVCLQELKADENAFPALALRSAGYGAVWPCRNPLPS